MIAYTDSRPKTFRTLIDDIIVHGKIVSVRYEVSSAIPAPVIVVEFVHQHFWRLTYGKYSHGLWYMQELFKTATYAEPEIHDEMIRRALQIIHCIEEERP